jgi:hypothetical protein
MQQQQEQFYYTIKNCVKYEPLKKLLHNVFRGFLFFMITIKILNWEKWNIRTGGIARPFWFSFSNQFFQDPAVAELDVNEIVVFVYLLCEASQANNKGEFELSVKKFERSNAISQHILFKALDKLVLLKKIKSSRTHAERTPNDTRQDKTEQDKTNNTKSVVAPPVFDLEKIFKEYPKRLGNQNKKQGMQRLTKFIKNEDDFNKALQAVHKYKNHCVETKKDNTPFVKQFGTFFDSRGDWLEWVDFSNSKTQEDWKKRMMEMLHD